MAKLTIRMVDTAAGPQVTVDYESEADALAHEHERDHRAAVAALLGLSPAELAALGISVERAATTAAAGEPAAEPAAPAAKTATGEGR